MLSIDEYDVPDSDEGMREEKMDLWSAVCSLPKEYRAVVILFYYEQMSIIEISHVLDIKQANVKTRLARGREKLRTILQSEVSGDERNRQKAEKSGRK
jgi:RNA polymerase sigma-70 factor, ECF subfamily